MWAFIKGAHVLELLALLTQNSKYKKCWTLLKFLWLAGRTNHLSSTISHSWTVMHVYPLFIDGYISGGSLTWCQHFSPHANSLFGHRWEGIPETRHIFEIKKKIYNQRSTIKHQNTTFNLCLYRLTPTKMTLTTPLPPKIKITFRVVWNLPSFSFVFQKFIFSHFNFSKFHVP